MLIKKSEVMAARESCPKTRFRELDEERAREVRVKRGAAFQFGIAVKIANRAFI